VRVLSARAPLPRLCGAPSGPQRRPLEGQRRRRHATTARRPGRPPTNRDDELVPPIRAQFFDHGRTLDQPDQERRRALPGRSECERAFADVKNALINAPILSCPDFEHPFTLQCDASDIGIGAVLTQNIDGHERVVCYLSRALLPAEQRYTTTEKE
jgi:hypothetical protein